MKLIMTSDNIYRSVNNRCSKCGKPKIYVGDVPERMLPGTEPYCTCDQIFGRVQSGGVGWVCPKCGRSNAPWVATCGCGPNITITYGTSTSPVEWKK